MLESSRQRSSHPESATVVGAAAPPRTSSLSAGTRHQSQPQHQQHQHNHHQQSQHQQLDWPEPPPSLCHQPTHHQLLHSTAGRSGSGYNNNYNDNVQRGRSESPDSTGASESPSPTSPTPPPPSSHHHHHFFQPQQQTQQQTQQQPQQHHQHHHHQRGKSITGAVLLSGTQQQHQAYHHQHQRSISSVSSTATGAGKEKAVSFSAQVIDALLRFVVVVVLFG